MEGMEGFGTMIRGFDRPDAILAGIESRVPVDQVIDCMGDVGRRLPVELRETALGGLAATPFGQSVKAKREERRSQEQEL